MSQERWDVVLRFIDGPLSYQGDIVCRGPVVRMGASPGPGGLVLDGYRGLDNRQAVITAYDGGSVAIAPVGTNQVRVAPHESVDWNEIHTLRGPVYLSPGSAFHLGPPGRGASAVFVECRRLGVWEQRRILSEAAQADSSSVQPIRIEELNTQKGIPRWFIPAVLVIAMLTVVGTVIPLVKFFERDTGVLGPAVDGEAVYAYVDATQLSTIETSVLEGMQQPFQAFVMNPNAEVARWDELKDPAYWDQDFFRYVSTSVKYHSRARNFWRRLEEVKDEYHYVVSELVEAGLPTVFAAIPYQESRYTASVTSPVCAEGWWQFMPETANRYNLEVSGCKFSGSSVLWSPTEIVTPYGIMRNAPYVSYNAEKGTARCKIQRCEVDERRELEESTRAAIEMLKDSWTNPQTQESGAAVQITIMAHNGGFNDAQYRGKSKPSNVLAYYQRHLARTNQERAPDFYGKNITCDPTKTDPHKANYYTDKCGGLVPNQTQHYAYSIVAQHILAVCYYAENHGSEPAFSAWRDYVLADGYCSMINVPDIDSLREGGR